MLGTALLWLWNHFTYSIQRVSTLSFSQRLLVLAFTSVVHVGLGAFLYRLASGDTWSCALFKSYGVLFRAPGFAVSNETTLAASLVMNTLFIFGMFVFAVLIGMISDEIKQQIQAMRVGDVELRLRGHTLVLNWNGLTLSLLRQLCHAQNDPKHRLYKKPVVLLADRNKADMDLAVFNAMRGLNFEVFIRSGRPSKQQDLLRVAAHTAATVLLLQPEPCSSAAAAEALKATTLISLRCLQLSDQGSNHGTYYQPGSSSRAVKTLTAAICRRLDNLLVKVTGKRAFIPMYSRLSRSSSSFRAIISNSKVQSDAMRVVVQVPNMQPGEDDLLGFLHSTTASVSNVQGARLLSQRMLDRLVAQAAVQPGTAHAFREILRAGSNSAQLCFCDVNQQLVGTYRAAQQQFVDAILIGVLPATTRQLQLNPPDDYQLLEGDRLLGFTRHGRLAPRLASRPGSPGWKRLSRPMSRASSMSSRGLHMVSSNSSIATDHIGSQAATLGPDRPLNILVVGWAAATVPGLLASLQEIAPEGSCFTVLHQKGQVQQANPEQTAVTAAAVAAAAAAAIATAARQSSSSLDELDDSSASGATNSSQKRQQQPLQHVQLPQEHVQEPPGSPAGQDQQQRQLSTCKNLHVSEPCSVQALLSAGILDADSVIIGGDLAPQTAGEADAMVVATLLAIQQALQPGTATGTAWQSTFQQDRSAEADQASNSHQQRQQELSSHTIARRSETGTVTQLHVVAVLSSYSLRRATQVFLGSMLVRSYSYEVLVLDEYAAAMLVQVAQEPATSLVMDQLLVQTTGSGLLMWPAEALGFKVDKAVTFQQVSKAVRRHRSTALGYRRADGRMLLAPSAGDRISFQRGDRIVVVGSDS